MKLSVYDQKFQVDTSLQRPGLCWVDAKDSPVEICGLAFHDKGDWFRRIPQSVADTVNPGVS